MWKVQKGFANFIPENDDEKKRGGREKILTELHPPRQQVLVQKTGLQELLSLARWRVNKCSGKGKISIRRTISSLSFSSRFRRRVFSLENVLICCWSSTKNASLHTGIMSGWGPRHTPGHIGRVMVLFLPLQLKVLLMITSRPERS